MQLQVSGKKKTEKDQTSRKNAILLVEDFSSAPKLSEKQHRIFGEDFFGLSPPAQTSSYITGCYLIVAMF